MRCRSDIPVRAHPRALSRTAAFALAGLVLYPLALMLPVMTLERFGHASSASIWSGMVGLLAEGHWAVGLTVLVFSIIVPIVKLVLLLVLCAGGLVLGRRQRAWSYRAVELVGRWGMLDVLLVAVLVAAVKLGDVVSVTPNAGAGVFGGVVLLSLLASLSFDPHAIWTGEEGDI